MKNSIHKDFDIFTRALIHSNDADPVYPLLKDIVDCYEFDPVWFTFVYVAFYDLGSAIKVCQEFTPVNFKEEKYKRFRTENKLHFGHERRGNVRSIINQTILLKAVIRNKEQLQDVSMGSDDATFKQFIKSTVPFHGNWSAYKINEIFEKSFNRKNLSIGDLGLTGRDPNSNDGPVGGLRWLYGRDNEYSKDWFEVWDKFGANLAKAYKVDVGLIETSLCKFHKTVSGNYFIGHDIQEFCYLKEVMGEEVHSYLMAKNFDANFWEEKSKLEKEHNKIYKTKGILLNSEYAEASPYPEVDVLKVLVETE